jgi:hypothetical protein
MIYAQGIIWYCFQSHKRFPKYESIIAKDPYASYCYARYIIKDRWELGEPSIARHFKIAYDYAKDVLKYRFVLGENTIKNNKYYRKKI